MDLRDRVFRDRFSLALALNGNLTGAGVEKLSFHFPLSFEGDDDVVTGVAAGPRSNRQRFRADDDGVRTE